MKEPIDNDHTIKDSLLFVGLDVHAQNITIALAFGGETEARHRSQSVLGDFFRRVKARLGAPEFITATAHHLARILYHLITHRYPDDASVRYRGRTPPQTPRKRSPDNPPSAAFQLTPLQCND